MSSPKGSPQHVSAEVEVKEHMQAQQEHQHQHQHHQQPPQDDDANDGTVLYVRGLHPRTTEEDLVQDASNYGGVLRCRIITDPATQMGRGFGFIYAKTVQDADTIMANFRECDHKRLAIEKAKQKSSRPPTPGAYLGKRSASDDGEGPFVPYRARDQPYPPRGYRDYPPRYRDYPPPYPPRYRDYPPQDPYAQPYYQQPAYSAPPQQYAQPAYPPQQQQPYYAPQSGYAQPAAPAAYPQADARAAPPAYRQ